MKKLMILSVMALVFITGSFAQQGESSLGVKLSYNTDAEITGVGVKYQYNLTEQLRVAPAFTYFIQNHDSKVSAYAFDVDLHYLFPLEYNLTLYPIAGLNFTNIDQDSNTDSGFGLNAGVGIQYPVADNLVLNAEWKRSILMNLNDQPVISFGVSYKF